MCRLHSKDRFFATPSDSSAVTRTATSGLQPCMVEPGIALLTRCYALSAVCSVQYRTLRRGRMRSRAVWNTVNNLEEICGPQACTTTQRAVDLWQ